MLKYTFKGIHFVIYIVIYCYWHYSWKFIAICLFVHWLNLLLSYCLFLCYSRNLECKMANFLSLVLAVIGGYVNCTYILNFRNKSLISCSLSFLWGEFYIKPNLETSCVWDLLLFDPCKRNCLTYKARNLIPTKCYALLKAFFIY